MAQVNLPSGVFLEYESMGNPSNPTLLWIMGFGAQMTAWPDEFLQLYVDAGFHVVRFDNRDCGLSFKHDGVMVDVGAVTAAALMGDPPPPVPYTLSDMAADAIGVLDDLNIDKAHIVGASMGGMIAQTLAIEFPERVHSLISVMSVPGDMAYGTPTPEALTVLVTPPPSDRAAYVEGAKNWAIWCSKKHFDLDDAKARAGREFDRSFYPEGTHRQMAAIYASGDRTEKLQELVVPTLVIHGRDDTLLTPSGGERTAELVQGSVLMMVADMGHDLPRPLWPMFVDAISAHARRSHL